MPKRPYYALDVAGGGAAVAPGLTRAREDRQLLRREELPRDHDRRERGLRGANGRGQGHR